MSALHFQIEILFQCHRVLDVISKTTASACALCNHSIRIHAISNFKHIFLLLFCETRLIQIYCLTYIKAPNMNEIRL